MFGEVFTTVLAAVLCFLDMPTLNAAAVVYTARVLPTSPVNGPITKLPENGIPGYKDGNLPQLRYGIGSYDYYDDNKRMHLVTYINDHKGFKILNDYIPFHHMDFVEELRKNTSINDMSLIKYDDDEDDDFEDDQQMALLSGATEPKSVNDESSHQMAAPVNENNSPMEAFKTHFQNLFALKDSFSMPPMLYNFSPSAKTNDKVNESINNAKTETKGKSSINHNFLPLFPRHFPFTPNFNAFDLQQGTPTLREGSSTISINDEKIQTNTVKNGSTDQLELAFRHFQFPEMHFPHTPIYTPHFPFLREIARDTSYRVINEKLPAENNDLLSVESKPLSTGQINTGTLRSFTPLTLTRELSSHNPDQKHDDQERSSVNPIIRHFAVHTISYPYPLKFTKQE